jgi:hypothetical protein
MPSTVEPGQIWADDWRGKTTYVRVERRWRPSDAHPGDDTGPAWWVETCDAKGNVDGRDRYVAEPHYFGSIYRRAGFSV